MQLNEIVKNFLKQPEKTELEKDSSAVSQKNILVDLTNSDSYPNTGAFFDSEQFQGGLFGLDVIANLMSLVNMFGESGFAGFITLVILLGLIRK